MGQDLYGPQRPMVREMPIVFFLSPFSSSDLYCDLLLNGLVGSSRLGQDSTLISSSSMIYLLLTFQISVPPLAMADGWKDRHPLTLYRQSYFVAQKARPPPF